MKRLISSGSASLVSPPAVQGATVAALNASGPALALTTQESKTLVECETRIEQGLETFIDVGQALATIKDSRLYRGDYGTFEEYVRERWDMSSRHAYRLVDGAEIARNLLPPAPAPDPEQSAEDLTNWSQPQSESQVRPLKGLEPDQQREVWQQAVKSAREGQVTAKHVEQAREQLHPKESRVIDVMFERVDQGGDIDSTNCHDLLAASRRTGVVPELKKIFGHGGHLWVVSLGHHGPAVGVITQEAHELCAPDEGFPPANGPDYFAEGRIVLWKGRRYRLGPKVIFRGDKTQDQMDLEEKEIEDCHTPMRTVAVGMSRAVGDIREAYSADKLTVACKPPYKIRKPFEFEGRLWTVTAGCNALSADGRVEHDGHELVPEADYDGPLQRPKGYTGALVQWKGKRYRLGPLVVFKAWETPKLKLEAEETKPESPGSPCE